MIRNGTFTTARGRRRERRYRRKIKMFLFDQAEPGVRSGQGNGCAAEFNISILSGRRKEGSMSRMRQRNERLVVTLFNARRNVRSGSLIR